MSEMEKLAAELGQGAQRAEQAKASSRETIESWLKDLEALVETVDGWLTPLKNTNQVTTSREEIDISEAPTHELATRYRAPVLTIKFKGKTIKFVPVGRYMIGNNGVVELRGLPRQVAIDRLLDGELCNWRIRVLANKQRPDLMPLTSDNFASLLRLC
ncbi:hypothetical protein [Metapseudomonas otitidis]|uniref:hypothetical protein n=1 Tax=Metapseudomonas otitidis TaxID=319939 RepID=UPI0013F5F15C|nr:hypothetical protein [Pseudomonas otitidis]